LDFGWLVATTPLPELYDEALVVLQEFRRDTFPIDRYRGSAIHALIFDSRGDREQARNHARTALQAAQARHSGFRYHATVGLVETSDKGIHQRLSNLAA
jgi:hypothetical protein